MDYQYFLNQIKQIQLIKLPSLKISSFGETSYIYYIVTNDKNTHQSIIREGSLILNKPLIIGYDNFKEVFQGFSDDTLKNVEALFDEVGNQLKLLGYQFKQVIREKWVEKQILPYTLKDLKAKVGGNPMSAILIGNEEQWELPIVRLTSEIIKRSLKINIKEFEEKGYFDKNGVAPKIYEKIETLFSQSLTDKNKIKDLGQLLQRYHLFEEYEERFFSLFN